MKTETLINYFKTQAAAASALGIKRQAVCRWNKKGVVPLGRAYEIQAMTNGALKVDRALYQARQ